MVAFVCEWARDRQVPLVMGRAPRHAGEACVPPRGRRVLADWLPTVCVTIPPLLSCALALRCPLTTPPTPASPGLEELHPGRDPASCVGLGQSFSSSTAESVPLARASG